MKQPIVVGLCLAALAATAAGAQEKASADKAPHRFHHRAPPPSAVIPRGATAQVLLPPVDVTAVPSFFLHIAPYPDNNSDDVDGLSRNVNDCNKGCIDTAP